MQILQGHLVASNISLTLSLLLAPLGPNTRPTSSLIVGHITMLVDRFKSKGSVHAICLLVPCTMTKAFPPCTFYLRGVQAPRAPQWWVEPGTLWHWFTCLSMGQDPQRPWPTPNNQAQSLTTTTNSLLGLVFWLVTLYFGHWPFAIMFFIAVI